MATIHNQITINAPVEKLWTILTTMELLDRYDPTVKQSTLLPGTATGIGAKRRVLMQDGKNWFEEKITVYIPNQTLTIQLTDCTFPIKGLTHSYSFETVGAQTTVKQVMTYTVKFGWLGKLMDVLMIRQQSDQGIKKFFSGLKLYAEKG